MQLNIYIIDAFTDTLFSGNQAAVIPLQSWLADDVMLSIAKENNLSETAFLVKNNDDVYEIRWFSPIKEIDFCGHATLASSYVIFQQHPALNTITFYAEAVGNVSVEKTDNQLIEMCFPNLAPTELTTIPVALQNGLSLKPIRYLQNRQAYFAVYNNEDDVRNVKPDLAKLTELAPFDVVVTAAVTSKNTEYDFASRYFWPANGGDEDPVTGSIHAGLAPFWSKELGKNTLVALQASARSGVLYCQVENDKVFISGQCVQYLKGNINI